MIQGIDCNISTDNVQKLLCLIQQTEYKASIPWCILGTKWMPYSISDSLLTIADLKDQCLWEFVVHLYPLNAEAGPIHTFNAFQNGCCMGCLIFYDCNSLEVYTKDQSLHERIMRLLVEIGAENIKTLDELTITRERMYP